MKKNMKIGLTVLTGLILISPDLLFASNGFQVYTRQNISLDGTWKYIVDPYENGYYNYRYEPFDQQVNPPASAFFTDSRMKLPSDLIEYDFDKAPEIQVPGDWNTQNPKLYYYEGTVWYRKTFESPALKSGERVFLYFGAANYKSEVYLNSKKLGTHLGGFTHFYYEISSLLRSGSNSLVVKVDNKRSKEAVPTLNTDWWNYGGITRSVQLVVVPATYITDYFIHLESVGTKTISGYVNLDKAVESELTLSIPELKISQKLKTDSNGKASFSLVSKHVELWSPENPKLYRIELSIATDRLIDSVGFRTINTQGKQLLLNGKPIFLRGISIHEENSADGGGRVNSPAKATQLLNWAQEMGCNFVRLAHYPHNEDMVRIAERMGILVWSEIPVYWTIDWKNPDTYANAEGQLIANIHRDKNRANVIIWSIANETPVIPARTEFLSRLITTARSLDNSRLLSAAMEKHGDPNNPNMAIVQDPLADMVDLVSFNEYVGWYDGLPEKCDRVEWQIPYNKPVFISEFGGSAKFGYHGDVNTRFTEEFQEELYKKNLVMLEKIDGLCGMSPWILTDFRSPRRLLNGLQDDYNRKGLYSNTGEKKKAFFVLQEYYKNKAQSTK